MAFTKVTGQHAYTASSGTSITVTLPTNPTAGNIVVVWGLWAAALSIPTITAQDANSNTYTQLASSPETSSPTVAGAAYMFYLLSAPANATKAITVSFTQSAAASSAGALEFASSGGSVARDTDVSGNGTGTAVNTPSVTPAAAGRLLMGYASCAHQINTVDSPWTSSGLTMPLADGDAAGYILSSASGATALAMTQNLTGAWSSLILALSEASGAAFIAHPPVVANRQAIVRGSVI